MGLFEYFDRTRIVNLAFRDDRRVETEEEFARYGFPIQANGVQFFEASSPNEAAGFPSPGVRGCFLSHQRIIEEALASDAPNILILEDDICFSSRIAELEASIVDELKRLDWDIVYFGHSLPIDSGVPRWEKLTKPTIQSHFYAINGKTLKEFSGFLERMSLRPAGHPDGGPMHYDGALNTFREQSPDISVYYYTLNLGYQRPSKTDLHQTPIFDRYKVFLPFTRIARKLKTMFMRMTR